MLVLCCGVLCERRDAGEGLVCVVWPHRAPNFPALPLRLGAVHCANRPCGLWHVRMPADDSAQVNPPGLADVPPRFWQEALMASPGVHEEQGLPCGRC